MRSAQCGDRPSEFAPDGSRERDLRFRRSCRLGCSQQFKRVFEKPVRIDGAGYVVLARASEFPFARLGLAISKRSCPRAVDRNKLKRLARESFRANMGALPAVDLVVLCARNVGQLRTAHLSASLAAAWQRITEINQWDKC